MSTQQNPPDTNRGVETKVSLLIDWISVTFPKGSEVSYPSQLTTNKIETHGMNAYNTGARYEDGRIELSHTLRPEMGTHIICSGETLRNMPIDAQELLKFWCDASAKVRRLDLAVDAVNWHLTPETAKFLISIGAVKTRAREFPHWQDTTKKGLTQYVGKKSSEVFARIYDKAAEMGLSGDHTRVEVVFSGDKAQSAAIALVSGAGIRSLIRGFLDFPAWGVWLSVMESTPIKLPHVETLSNTETWLLRQVAPALAKQLELRGNDEFWFKFIEAVRIEREILSSKNAS